MKRGLDERMNFSERKKEQRLLIYVSLIDSTGIWQIYAAPIEIIRQSMYFSSHNFRIGIGQGNIKHQQPLYAVMPHR